MILDTRTRHVRLLSVVLGSRSAGEEEYVKMLSEAGGAEDMLCCICLDSLCDTELSPCGHVNMCGSCATEVFAASQLRGECPICRAVVESFRNVDTGEVTELAAEDEADSD